MLPEVITLKSKLMLLLPNASLESVIKHTQYAKLMCTRQLVFVPVQLNCTCTYGKTQLITSKINYKNHKLRINGIVVVAFSYGQITFSTRCVLGYRIPLLFNFVCAMSCFRPALFKQLIKCKRIIGLKLKL